MSLKNLSKVEKNLRKFIKDKNVLDVVLFGSYVKSKALPKDVDVAVIHNSDFNPNENNSGNLEGFHISFLKYNDFFGKTPSLVNTLFREGYSLKYKKNFSELYGFSVKCMFIYDLSNLSDSKKVKISNVLHGRGGEKGMVLEKKGEWVSRKIFTCPVSEEHLFERFFTNFKIKFQKQFLLIH